MAVTPLATRTTDTIKDALPPPKPGEEWIALHTDAPVDFDGFSTRTVKVVGKNEKGRDVRLIEILKRDYDWQTMRYSSGMFIFYTNEKVTLEQIVKLGIWFID